MRLSKIDVTKLSLPPGKTDHIEWDDELPGFGVRMRPTKRVYIVQFRIGRQQRRESLGDVRKITLDQARKIARQRFAQVELGIDPAAERDHARAQAAAAKLTLAVVAQRYLDAKRDQLARMRSGAPASRREAILSLGDIHDEHNGNAHSARPSQSSGSRNERK